MGSKKMTIKPVNPLLYILLQSETTAVRFWFGLTSLFFGLFMWTHPEAKWEYLVTYIIMPHWMWGIGFMVSGAAVLIGAVTKKYSWTSMFFEAILGTVLWVSVSVSSMMSQGSPGAVTIAGLMSMWLLVRYPTWNGRV